MEGLPMLARLNVTRKAPMHFRFYEVEASGLPIWCKIEFAGLTFLVAFESGNFYRAFNNGACIDTEQVLDRNGFTLDEAINCAFTNFLLDDIAE